MATKFDSVRSKMMEDVKGLFEQMDFDVLRTGSQELCIPIVGDEDEEGYMVLTFKVPKGSRDGDPYDGYEMAEEYRIHCEEQKAKAEASAKKKAEKMKKDAEARRLKAEAKAKREAEG